jgi:hypothetical protein
VRIRQEWQADWALEASLLVWISFIALYFIGSEKMLGTIAIILIVLWLLGMVSAYTMGGFIHILLVIAVVVILVRVIQGRRL